MPNPEPNIEKDMGKIYQQCCWMHIFTNGTFLLFILARLHSLKAFQSFKSTK